MAAQPVVMAGDTTPAEGPSDLQNLIPEGGLGVEENGELKCEPLVYPAVNYPVDTYAIGFILLDVLNEYRYNSKKNEPQIVCPMMYADDMAKAKELGLEQFKPLYSFKPDAKPKDAEEPWLNQDLDITKKADAEKLVNILQRYVYEGWFANDTTPGKMDYEKHFRQNTDRTWCNTPWLNLTEKGREAIHGLTKEFPIAPTSVYDVPSDIYNENPLIEKAVTWGISYFNRKVCLEYDKFFHMATYDKSLSDHEEGIANMIESRKPKFDSGDGALSFKLLFNAMENWQDRMKGQWTSEDGSIAAYNWWSHVSHVRNDDKVSTGDESLRKLMNVAHVQMDISFRDSRIKGTKDSLKNWIMTTYYYDPNYINPYIADMDIPEALKHMRPVGIQYGIDAGESIIFDGARNNHKPEGEELPFEATRLNGPVDNPKSNCLGCHALSGVNFGLPPMTDKDGNVMLDKSGKPRRQFAPGLGFLTEASYQDYFTRAGKGSFDFNMQLDKAMRNFSNSKAHKIIFPELQDTNPVHGQ